MESPRTRSDTNRWMMTDPLTFAVLLTVTTLALALGFTDTEPAALFSAWGGALSQLFAFTMQMALIIATAYALAQTTLVNRLLLFIADCADKPIKAYLLVIFTGAGFSLISWPLGPITAALVARKIATQASRTGLAVHYPLLTAGGFGGFVVWEMGYSSSIALAVASESNPTFEAIGRLIPIQETLLTWWNLAAIALTLGSVALTVLILHRRLAPQALFVPEDMVRPLAAMEEKAALEDDTLLPRIPSVFLAALILGYVGLWFSNNGVSLQLDIVNWTFLGLGLLFARSLSQYSDHFADGAKVASPTLLQYPLYAGIMGIGIYSGLAENFTAWLVSISGAHSLPGIAFLSAGLINIFIPSGGAQWALQGPSFIEAAKHFGNDLGLISMAVAYGDQWTNLIQPFTAIPVLALSGLRLRHLLSFSALICLVATAPLLGMLLIANVMSLL